jgi:hypothetical protein
MGYASSNKANGANHTQAGKPPPCPMASTDSGKPPATNTRRHVVAATAGHRARQAPKAVGNTKVTHKGACAQRSAQAKAQAAAQVNKAGRGQGSVNTDQA